MNAEVRRAYWVHYRNAENSVRICKSLITEIDGDLQAMSRAMHGEPSLIENGFPYIVNRLDELAQYAREIKASIEQKREDGAAADRRIDAMIEAAR